MSPSLTADQVNRIVANQHHDPFEILGPHAIEENGKSGWVIRAYLPNAESATVVIPGQGSEYPMNAVHHPHFFECNLTGRTGKTDL
jgi:1,4-alpha-glucan branching enzyme